MQKILTNKPLVFLIKLGIVLLSLGYIYRRIFFKENIALESKVVENFLANPFNGGNELEWETKIVIPFAKK